MAHVHARACKFIRTHVFNGEAESNLYAPRKAANLALFAKRTQARHTDLYHKQLGGGFESPAREVV